MESGDSGCAAGTFFFLAGLDIEDPLSELQSIVIQAGGFGYRAGDWTNRSPQWFSTKMRRRHMAHLTLRAGS